jgi:hypothetical protein
MDFTATLVEKLKARGLTDSSVSLYVRNLEKLNANKPLNNLNFLKKYNDIMEKLKGYKGNTQRGLCRHLRGRRELTPSSKNTIRR